MPIQNILKDQKAHALLMEPLYFDGIGGIENCISEQQQQWICSRLMAPTTSQILDVLKKKQTNTIYVYEAKSIEKSFCHSPLNIH